MNRIITYDIAGLNYDIVGKTYDVMGFRPFVATLTYDITYAIAYDNEGLTPHTTS